MRIQGVLAAARYVALGLVMVLGQITVHSSPQSLRDVRSGKITFLSGSIKSDGFDYSRGVEYSHFEGNLYAMNPDGSSKTLLKSDVQSNPYGDGRLSPDGQHRIFLDGDFVMGLGMQMYVGKPNRDDKSVKIDEGNYIVGPSWSLDGKRIVFASGTYYQNQYSTSLYIINADGTGKKRLTEDKEPRFAHHDTDPVFSPDGLKIAFTRRSDIYLINADGAQLQQLTKGGGDAFPSWSPDGRHIVFQRSDSVSQDGGENINIYVMQSNGKKVRRLTKEGTFMAPCWTTQAGLIK